MHIGKCELCSKETEYKFLCRVKRFCSYTCSNTSKWEERKRGEISTLSCGICNSKFSLLSSQLKAREKLGRKVKYCSSACMGKSHAKEGTRSPCKCSQCGKEIIKRTDHVTENNYCSRECAGIARQKEGPWSTTNQDKEALAIYMKNYAKLYAKTYPEKITHNVAKRRSFKKKATPKWADMNDIRFVYKLSLMAQRIHKIPYEVDHVIPLISDYVCGLHVYENLQILPKTQNRQKSNTFNVGHLMAVQGLTIMETR